MKTRRTMPPAVRSVLRWMVGLGIIGAVVIFLPTGELLAALGRTSPRAWILTLATFLLLHVVAAFKWRLLVASERTELSLPAAVRCHYAGLFANLFLPSVSGGDVVRAATAVAHGVRPEVTVVGGVVDRMVDVAALALLVTVGAMASTAAGLGANDLQILLWVIAGLAVGGAALAAGLSLPVRRLPEALSRRIENVRQQLMMLARNPARAATAGVLAIAVQGSLVVVAAQLGGGLGIEIAPATWLLAWPLAKLAATLPVSVGGLGVREVALAMILARFGVPESLAVGLGLLWDTILISGGAIGGIAYLAAPLRRVPVEPKAEQP